MSNLILRFVVSVAMFSCTTCVGGQNIDWAADVEYLATTLAERHPNLFRQVSEEEFGNATNGLANRINELNQTQATLELMKLVALIGDGHTSVAPDFSKFSYFPINVMWFEDGVFVRAIDRKHKALIGAKLVAIGEVPMGQIEKRFGEILAHDNEWGVRKLIDKQLQTAQYLRYANALNDDGSATFHFETAKQKASLTLKAISPSENRVQFANSYSVGMMKPSIFLDLLIKDERKMPFWNDWISDHKTVYFKYNECRNPKAFKELVDGTAGFIAQNDIDKFVLDIRDNSGGSSLVFKPLLDFLLQEPHINREGKLFVIVGRNTFSSGIFAACDMKKTNAIFVGEPTGGRPNHFGEVKTFKLPNSGLTVQHSTKTFQLMDQDKDAFEPDLQISYRAEDVLAARDQALQAIFDYGKD